MPLLIFWGFVKAMFVNELFVDLDSALLPAWCQAIS